MNNRPGTSILSKLMIARQNNYRKKARLNTFVFVLAVFMTIAAIQAFELGGMLSEAKSIGRDVKSINAKQEILIEQYASYNSNLSYYLTNY